MSSTAEPLPFPTWACTAQTHLTPSYRLVSENFAYVAVPCYLLAINQQQLADSQCVAVCASVDLLAAYCNYFLLYVPMTPHASAFFL